MENLTYQFLSLYEKVYYIPFFRAGLVIVAVLFLIFSIGMVRQHYFHLTMKGANFGILAGILVTVGMESIILFVLIYGAKGIEIIQGKHNPAEIVQLTREGVGKVGAVLGSSTSIPDHPTATSLLEQIPKLSKLEEDKVKYVLCR